MIYTRRILFLFVDADLHEWILLQYLLKVIYSVSVY
jgi:hypothetical protein